MYRMRIALAVFAALVAVGIACGGGVALSESPEITGSNAALTIAERLPNHYWLVRMDAGVGCTGSMRLGTAWGCSPPESTGDRWNLFGGSAELAQDGGYIALGDDDGTVMPPHGYPVPRDAGHAPIGQMTGSFTDARHFEGSISGWGAPLPISLELLREE